MAYNTLGPRLETAKPSLLIGSSGACKLYSTPVLRHPVYIQHKRAFGTQPLFGVNDALGTRLSLSASDAFGTPSLDIGNAFDIPSSFSENYAFGIPPSFGTRDAIGTPLCMASMTVGAATI
ncbi:hypothetical protein L3X38_041991 [Prunus dulcis]|uniref:Uncharacterized protein n=1 Tax=Prunus dulcis TaxID=3755 RepID=A0AAD4YJW1_PRUDU|nr:hypothetical protein L3X38_041991 [Prunus dulcis]